MDIFYIWLGICVALLIAEATTTNLITIWFAGGAFAALLVSIYLPDSYLLQIIVFIVVSVILLLATRRIVKKMQVKHSTNVDALIGKVAVVTADIDNINAVGEATINGNIWTARSQDGSVIENGAKVIVVAIEGVKLIVKKEEE